MLRTLLTLFALTLVSQARAQATVTLDWVAPGPITVSSTTTALQQVRLRYTVEGGGVSGVTLAVTMPDDVYPQGFTTPPSFTGGTCSLVAGGSGTPSWASWQWTCSFQAPLIDATSGAISGDIVFNILPRRYAHPSGKPLNFGAVFAGTGVPGGSVAYNEAIPAAAASNLSINTANVFALVAGEYNTGPGLVPGIFTRYRRALTNTGTAAFEPGATFDVEIPASDYLVDLDLGTGWSVRSGDNSAYVGQAGGTIALGNSETIRSWNHISNVGVVNGTGFHGITSYVYFTVFVPCSAMGNPRFGYDMHTSASANERRHDGTLIARSDSENLTTSVFDTCGTLPSPSKTTNIANPGPGTTFVWTVQIRPPYGVDELSDPLIVDPIPAGVTLLGASLSSAENRAEIFEVFYCNVPAFVGTSFGLTTFLSVAGTACVSLDDSPTPAEIAAATHVVAYSDVWQEPQSEPGEWHTTPAPDAPRTVRLLLSMRVNDDTPTGPITNTAAYSASDPTISGTVSNTIQVNNSAQPLLLTGTYSNPSGTVANSFFPGNPISFGVVVRRDNGIGPMLRDSKLRVVFPPSVVITGIDTADLTGVNCGAPAASWNLQLGGNPQYAEIEIDPNTDERWLGCNNNAAHTGVHFIGTVSTTYPHVDTQPLSATIEYFFKNADAVDSNNDSALLTTAAAPYTFKLTAQQVVVVDVAAEMRLRLAAACPTNITGAGAQLADDLLAAHGSAGFIYDFVTENSGGRTLTDVSIDITIPKVGSPVGNTLNSNFFGIVPPAGGAVSYCTAPAVCSPTPPGDLSTVTSLQVTFAQAAAYTDTHTLVFLSHGSGAPIGTPILTAGTLDANELGEVGESDYVPFEVGQCRTPLVIEKFFDANGNGTRDAGEPVLSGWAFTATNAGDTQSGTTDGAGRLELLVTPGLWDLSETLPAGPVTWSSTTWTNGSGVATSALDVGLGVVPVQVVGNVCTCTDDNPCTTDTCSPTGVCESVGECPPTCGPCEVLSGNTCVPNPGVACADGDTSLCTNGICNAQGACDVTTVSCNGQVVGACSAACDAETGLCTEPILPDECAPPNDGWVFYVSLTGDGGPLQVRCVLDPDTQAAPTCAVVTGQQCGE